MFRICAKIALEVRLENVNSNEFYFSIVIPVYNRSVEVLNLLDTLQEQTFKNFEVIIVDDGSDDDVGSQFRSDYGFPVKLVRQENSGGGAARNNGILRSSGRYIAFLDSDDFFMPNKLSTFKEWIDTTNATMLFSYARVDRGEGVFGRKPNRPIRSDESFEHYALIARQPAQTSTLVVETELAKSVLFDPKLKKFQDIDFGLRLAAAGAKICFVPEELTIWTDKLADGRVGNKRRPEMAKEWLEKNKNIMSKKGVIGFKANLLSYEIGESERLLAAWYIVDGVVRGGVSLKRSLHSFTRALIPQAYYRSIIDRLLLIKTKMMR